MYFLVNVTLPKLLELCSLIVHMMLMVLGNTSCDLDPKVKGQIMYFLVYTSPKPFDVVTSNFVGA